MVEWSVEKRGSTAFAVLPRVCRKRPLAFFYRRDTACRAHPLGTLAGRAVSFSRHMSPKMTNFDFILPPSGGKTLRGFPVGEVFRQVGGSTVFAVLPPRLRKKPRRVPGRRREKSPRRISPATCASEKSPTIRGGPFSCGSGGHPSGPPGPAEARRP